MGLKDRMQDSSNWILNSPESLVILMLMGTSIGSLFFFVLTLAMGFNKQWFFMALFGLCFYGALRQFIKIFKMVKATSIKDALGGITANEFVWHKGGKQNEYSGHKGDEMGSERNEEENRRFGEEIRRIYR